MTMVVQNASCVDGVSVDNNFEKKLRELINITCQEKYSNTPDFILAKYINNCLSAFNIAINKRDKYYSFVANKYQGDITLES